MAWSIHDVASACAAELESNDVVYLGAGLPRRLREHLTGRAIIAVDSGGIVGLGPAPRGRDRGLQPADGGEPVTVMSGGAIVGPVRAAAMLRRGWIEVGVVEAGQVDVSGALAPSADEPSPGHLREIAHGVGRLIACLQHRLPDGSPALRHEITHGEHNLGQAGCALVVTELGVFRPAGDGFELLKSAPSVDLGEIESGTDAPVKDVRVRRSEAGDREPSTETKEEDDDLLARAAPPPD
jgi:3-oxoacid CoA-transferase B subunit